MKKENKELAKQNRMQKKKREKFKKNFSLTLKIGIPTLLLVAIIVFCLFKPSSKNTSSEESQAETYTINTSYSVKMGDMINIDYVGYVDGVAFEGGTAEGQMLELGSGTYIDDFEEQLVGAHPGETVDVNVTFPKDYHSSDLAGKDATFKVTVNGVYE